MASPPVEEGPEDAPPPSDAVAARLEELTAAVASLEDRLDRLEARLRQDVSDEVHAAAGELRRTVSELGRRLALDLPQVLSQHRDAILAELRPSRSPGLRPDMPGRRAAPRAGTPPEPGGGGNAPVVTPPPVEPSAAWVSPAGGPEQGTAGPEQGAGSVNEKEVLEVAGPEPAGPPAEGPQVAGPPDGEPGATAEASPTDDAVQRRRASLLRRRGPR